MSEQREVREQVAKMAKTQARFARMVRRFTRDGHITQYEWLEAVWMESSYLDTLTDDEVDALVLEDVRKAFNELSDLEDQLDSID